MWIRCWKQIVHRIPAPERRCQKHRLKALIFDSLYDPYRGVIVFCRVMDGTGEKRHSDPYDGYRAVRQDVVEVGYFGAGQFIPCEELTAGMVGYITASLKNVKDTRVGDTVTDASNPCAEAASGL